MRTLTRFLLSGLTVLTLAGGMSLTGCYAEEYRDDHGHAYRHARWHDEHVYQREDGKWHARRNGVWVILPEVHID